MWACRERRNIGTAAKTSELGFVGISIALAIRSLDPADPRGYLDS